MPPPLHVRVAQPPVQQRQVVEGQPSERHTGRCYGNHIVTNEDPFAALGDANRRRIVALLAAGERSVRELADEMPISRPAVSRHLRLLKEAGLVTEHAEGTRRIYRLHAEGADAVEAFLREVWGDALTRFRIVVENT